MGTKITSVQVRTDKTFDEVRQVVKDMLRPLGGTQRDMGYGFDIDGGSNGVRFGFVSTIKAAVKIQQRGQDAYNIECTIANSPNALFWICFVVGWFFLWFLWIICGLYFFVNPAQAYERQLSQVEGVLKNSYGVSKSAALPVLATQGNLLTAQNPGIPPAMESGSNGQPQIAAPAHTNEAMTKLKQLQEMRDANLITAEQFDAKQQEILSKM